jgi:putative hydrolase of the HAD superfamily
MSRPQLPFPSCVLIDLDNTVYSYPPAHAAGLKGASKLAASFLNTNEGEFDDAYNDARAEIKRRLGSTASSHNRLLYFQRLLERLGLGSQIGYALELEQAYWSHFLSAASLRPQVVEFLDDLRLNGVPAVAVTDLTAAIQFRKMLFWQLDRYLDWIVTSEEAGCEKPAHQVFELALAKLGGIEGSVWMIGDDAEADIRGGKEAIDAVTIQIIGKGDSSTSSADVCISSFQELRMLLSSTLR